MAQMKHIHQARKQCTGRARGNTFSYRDGCNGYIPMLRYSTGAGLLKEDTFNLKEAQAWKAAGRTVKVIYEATGYIKEVWGC